MSLWTPIKIPPIDESQPIINEILRYIPFDILRIICKWIRHLDKHYYPHLIYSANLAGHVLRPSINHTYLMPYNKIILINIGLGCEHYVRTTQHELQRLKKIVDGDYIFLNIDDVEDKRYYFVAGRDFLVSSQKRCHYKFK